jgi:hypothetical protein
MPDVLKNGLSIGDDAVAHSSRRFCNRASARPFVTSARDDHYSGLLTMKPATPLLNAAPSPQDAELAPWARL